MLPLQSKRVKNSCCILLYTVHISIVFCKLLHFKYIKSYTCKFVNVFTSVDIKKQSYHKVIDMNKYNLLKCMCSTSTNRHKCKFFIFVEKLSTPDLRFYGCSFFYIKVILVAF